MKKKVPFHLPETATVCINGSPGCSAAGFYEAIFLFNNTTHIALSKSWCADQSLTLAGPWERQLHALEIKTKSIISVLKFCHFCTIDLQKKKKKNLTIVIPMHFTRTILPCRQGIDLIS